MAETSRLKLPYPTASEEVAKGQKTLEEALKLIDELMVAQNLVAHSAGATAKVGELLKMTATGTVTLPAASANAIVGVICAGGESTIKTASGKIYGDFVTGAESIKLALYQHVILQSDGTSWYILAGEPKREASYGTRTEYALGTEHEASATRETLVVGDVQLEPKSGFGVAVHFFVGGTQVAEAFQAEGSGLSVRLLFTFIVPAGQKWKAEVATGSAAGLYASYLPR